MKITKKQKQQLIDLNDSRVNEILELGLKVGEWYKGDKDFQSLICITKTTNECIGIKFNRLHYFGFLDGRWVENDYIANTDHEQSLIKATHQEVEQALTDEAKRRGFKKGVKFKSLSENGKIRTISDKIRIDYYIYTNILTISTSEEEWDNKHDVQSNPTIFKDGAWAEIIDEKPKQNKLTIYIKPLYTSDKQKQEVFMIEELEDNKILVEFKNKERLILSKDCIVI